MALAEIAAYPLLLAASYGIYRVGRRTDAKGTRRFAALRITSQGAVFGLVAAITLRLVDDGLLELPLGFLVPGLALPGLVGLVAIDVYQVAQEWAAPGRA